MVRRTKPILILTLCLTAAASSCGGGGSGEREALSRAYQDVEDYFRSESVIRDPSVQFKPPAVIPSTAVASTTAETVHSLGDQLAVVINESPGYVKTVFCTDFGFYVQTGRIVPTPEELVQLVGRQLLSRTITGPPAVQFREKVESFRQAILAARTNDEAKRNAAIAAVCAL